MEFHFYNQIEPNSAQDDTFNRKNREAYNAMKQQNVIQKKSHFILGSPSAPTNTSHIERVQQSLRSKIRAWIVKSGQFRYIDHLDDLVENYNASKHRSTGYTPNELYVNQHFTTVNGRQLARLEPEAKNDTFTTSDKINYVAILRIRTT